MRTLGEAEERPTWLPSWEGGGLSRMRTGITRARRALAFGLIAVLVFTAQAAGQSPPPSAAPGSVDAATLEALCAANTPDEGALANCLAVVHAYLVPGSGTDQPPAAPETPVVAPLP